MPTPQESHPSKLNPSGGFIPTVGQLFLPECLERFLFKVGSDPSRVQQKEHWHRRRCRRRRRRRRHHHLSRGGCGRRCRYQDLFPSVLRQTNCSSETATC